MEQRKLRRRAGTAVIGAIFIVLAILLIRVQLVNGAEYKAASSSLSVSQTTVKASRGEILDTYGNPLVSNRQGNSLIFKYDYFPSYKDQAARNALINSLIELMEQEGVKWVDNLPVKAKKNGTLYIDKNEETEFSYMVSANMLDLESGEKATADECLDALIERYSLSDYDRLTARKIASVCFGMKYVGFSSTQSYTFAEDVSTELVSKVLEKNSTFPGVDTQAVSYREYSDKTSFSHILGVVGSISAEEYAEEKQKLDEKLKDETLSKSEIITIKNNAYALNDSYGKDGLENAMESYLRGTNGIKATATLSDGSVSESYTVKPQEGNTVVTTIDAGLQKVSSKALAKVLESNRKSTYFGIAGAMVVIDVNTGAVLACVTLPTYDITKFFTNYSELAEDTSSPLWNRALQSTYAPGSTMKPAMAIAGLEEKVITETSTFYCGFGYHYLDHDFYCLSSHGYLNVKGALQNSCNIFFYEVGDRLGIDKMNKYSGMLGLGQKTGVELPEAQGVLASISNREAAGGAWNPGDTIQAAIGQSDNLFTPIQLANYCATIANGGTRYKPYLVKAVLSHDMSEVISETKPEVLNTLNVSKKTLSIVKEGMRDVVLYSSCQYYFNKCIVDAAGKTGTSQVLQKNAGGVMTECNNGFFISFAPYDKPEIAIAIVAENSLNGSGVSPAAVEVYNYYFSQREGFDAAETDNVLIP